MSKSVLVAHASKHGATAAIAKKVSQVLGLAGLRCELTTVDRIEDLDAYDAVVLGSAVYAGQWRREAVRFLEHEAEALAERPTWIFSSGPTGEGDPAELLKGWRFPEAQQPLVDRIKPRGVVVFHGSLNWDDLNMAEKVIVKGVKAPLGDFRDWEAIDGWARSIATALLQPDDESA